MSLLEWLGLGSSPHRDHGATAGPRSQSPAVAAIQSRLTSLGEDRARHVAAFAVVLARAARADLRVSAEETDRMREIVERVGGLDAEHAGLVVDLASSGALGGADEYLASRQLRQTTQVDERRRVLDALFAVAAADDSISLAEEEEIREVANELGLSHEDYVAARAAWRDQREVLRGLKRQG